MVIVLSGFNGIEGLVKSLYSKHGADLIIKPKHGKTFIADTVLINNIKNIPEITDVSRVIEETTMLKKGERWVTAVMKGVELPYIDICQINSSLIDGESNLKSNNRPQAIIGLGLQNKLLGPYKELINTIKVYGLQRDEEIKRNNENAFEDKLIEIGGVFNINPEINNQYFIVPIDFAKNILNYDNDISSIELGLLNNADTETVGTTLIGFGANIDLATPSCEALIRSS